MSAAISGFRRILRASKITFKSDTYALQNAAVTLKQEFRKNKDVTDKAMLAEMLKGVDEIEEMLLHNIVQGVKNEKGNFQVALASERHQVTVDAHQDDPHGPEISPVDPTYSGQEIPVTISSAKGRKGSTELINDL